MFLCYYMYVPFSLFLLGILLLYDGTYCEPALPRPVKRQTEIPSIPISELYPDEIYPVGFEMQYTVSGSCIDIAGFNPGGGGHRLPV